MSSARIAIVYHSGYGHTGRQAEAVKAGVEQVEGAEALLLTVDEAQSRWDDLAVAEAIIFGAPTYTGGASAAFKAFEEATSNVVMAKGFGWKDKIAAGFTNSASLNGDKFSTIAYFFTLSQQHGQVWIGTGLLPSNTKTSGPNDVNWAGGSAGALAISPSDASADEAPRSGDLETARLLGARVAAYAVKTRA